MRSYALSDNKAIVSHTVCLQQSHSPEVSQFESGRALFQSCRNLTYQMPLEFDRQSD